MLPFEPLISNVNDKKKAKTTAGDYYKLKIFDPAMGCGFFLIEAADFLARRIFAETMPDNDRSPSENFSEIRQNVIFNTLYGVELDKGAVAITQLVLWGLAGNPEIPIKKLEQKIVCGNALEMHTDERT